MLLCTQYCYSALTRSEGEAVVVNWPRRAGGKGAAGAMVRRGSRRARRARMEVNGLRSDEKSSAAPASTCLSSEHTANTSGDKGPAVRETACELWGSGGCAPFAPALPPHLPPSRLPLVAGRAACLALASPCSKQQRPSLFLAQPPKYPGIECKSNLGAGLSQHHRP